VSHNGFVSTIYGMTNRALRAALLVMLVAVPLAQAEPIELKVMTRNLYLGANLTPIFNAPVPGAIPLAVAGVWTNVVASGPQQRMDQVAQEILAERPHIVGLQEAVLWRTQTPASLSPATDAQFGGAFYQLLQNSLGALGLSYATYAVAQNGNNELPGLNLASPNFLTDYRLTDYDAILVRNDVQVLGSGAVNFAAQSVLSVAGIPVTSPRSYGYVDVVMSGIQIRAFNTHLDPLFGPINEAQGLELIDALDASPFRQVVMGDFNTVTEFGTTEVYQNMLNAGAADAWLDQGTGDGFTWRDDPLLNDPSILFSQRLDYIFHRGGFETLDVDLIGDIPFSNTRPMWPSDHAGLVATLRVVPAPGSLLLIILGLAAAGFARRRVRPS